jgi:hypothetical protein
LEGERPVYSLAIWHILCPFGNLVTIWYIFHRFGLLSQEKSGNSAFSKVATYLHTCIKQHFSAINTKLFVAAGLDRRTEKGIKLSPE